jgi:hypothetical protein
MMIILASRNRFRWFPHEQTVHVVAQSYKLPFGHLSRLVLLLQQDSHLLVYTTHSRHSSRQRW